tara:strand:+ start:92 stop:538 length:447 start_codon:yes stop_codon:yes gene_type:complete
MIKILFFYLNFILFFNLFTTSYLLANDGATGIIKERMDKFQKSKSLMKEINKGLQNNNFSIITKSSEKLVVWAQEMEKYFPEGSDIPPSKASSDIWNDPDGFKKAIKNFELASLELSMKSQNKNMDETIASFRNLAGTCKGCHQKYKN